MNVIIRIVAKANPPYFLREIAEKGIKCTLAHGNHRTCIKEWLEKFRKLNLLQEREAQIVQNPFFYNKLASLKKIIERLVKTFVDEGDVIATNKNTLNKIVLPRWADYFDVVVEELPVEPSTSLPEKKVEELGPGKFVSIVKTARNDDWYKDRKDIIDDFYQELAETLYSKIAVRTLIKNYGRLDNVELFITKVRGVGKRLLKQDKYKALQLTPVASRVAEKLLAIHNKYLDNARSFEPYKKFYELLVDKVYEDSQIKKILFEEAPEFKLEALQDVRGIIQRLASQVIREKVKNKSLFQGEGFYLDYNWVWNNVVACYKNYVEGVRVANNKATIESPEKEEKEVPTEEELEAKNEKELLRDFYKKLVDKVVEFMDWNDIEVGYWEKEYPKFQTEVKQLARDLIQEKPSNLLLAHRLDLERVKRGIRVAFGIRGIVKDQEESKEELETKEEERSGEELDKELRKELERLQKRLGDISVNLTTTISKGFLEFQQAVKSLALNLSSKSNTLSEGE